MVPGISVFEGQVIEILNRRKLGIKLKKTSSFKLKKTFAFMVTNKSNYFLHWGKLIVQSWSNYLNEKINE